MATREAFVSAVDGTRLYLRQQREREVSTDVTVLFCDGIACDGFIWKYLWPELGAYARVAHWNYRGHGRSEAPRDPGRIELADHATDLVSIHHALGDGPIVLVGHSMGCQVVLESLRQSQANVRGVVLICGAAGRITHTFKGTDILAQALPTLIERVDAHPRLARALVGHVPADVAVKVARVLGEVDGKTIDLEDMLPYMRHMVDIDLPMFLRMLRSAGDHTAMDLLGSLSIPALVIAGERDTFTPPRYGEQMAAAIPQSELLVVAGATHVAPLEQRELVNARVVSFLTERVGL